MLSQETKILFKVLLRDRFLHDELLDPMVNWDLVLKLGLLQGVFVEVYETLQQFASNDVKTRQLSLILHREKDVYSQLKKRCLAGLEITGKVAHLFEKYDIRYVFIKTLEYYPNFGSDIDILVHREDIRRASSALLNNGFEQCRISAPDKILKKFVCSNPLDMTYKIELYPQMSRVGEKWVNEEVVIRTGRVWQYEDIRAYIPNELYNFLLTCVHAVYRHGEFTVKEIINLIRFLRRNKINWKEITDITSQFGMSFGAFFAIAVIDELYKQIFGQTIPREGKKLIQNLQFNIEMERRFLYKIPIPTLIKAFVLKMASDIPKDLRSGVIIPAPLCLIILKRLREKSK
jgi:hypothetical protein